MRRPVVAAVGKDRDLVRCPADLRGKTPPRDGAAPECICDVYDPHGEVPTHGTVPRSAVKAQQVEGKQWRVTLYLYVEAKDRQGAVDIVSDILDGGVGMTCAGYEIHTVAPTAP
jgi:hypothetical protein